MPTKRRTSNVINLHECLTSRQAADLLGVSRERIKQLVREGKLAPIRRIGQSSLFHARDVLPLRDRPRQQPGSTGRPRKKNLENSQNCG